MVENEAGTIAAQPPRERKEQVRRAARMEDVDGPLAPQPSNERAQVAPGVGVFPQVSAATAPFRSAGIAPHRDPPHHLLRRLLRRRRGKDGYLVAGVP